MLARRLDTRWNLDKVKPCAFVNEGERLVASWKGGAVTRPVRLTPNGIVQGPRGSHRMASIHDLPTLGVDYQAQAVLAYVVRMVHWDRGGRALVDVPRLNLRSSTLINGRERHVAIVAEMMVATPSALLVTFGEHRNTDSIVVQVTPLDRAPFDQPTAKDLTEESYRAREEFDHGRVGDAADAVIRALVQYVKRVSKEGSN